MTPLYGWFANDSGVDAKRAVGRVPSLACAYSRDVGTVVLPGLSVGLLELSQTKVPMRSMLQRGTPDGKYHL